MPDSTVPNFLSFEVRSSRSIVGGGMGIGEKSIDGMPNDLGVLQGEWLGRIGRRQRRVV